MDEERRQRPTDEPKAPAEGVRIIGPDEAAEAIERGEVTARRSGDQPRYGDRPPPPPEGPRPALRFPLDASSDPTRIERPPVQQAPDPVTGPVELPHWTDPPTGEVPAVLIGDDRPLIEDDGDDLDAWSSFATSTPRWRDADDDWNDDGYMEHLASGSDDVRVGAMNDDDEQSHDEYFGFDDLEQRVDERRGEANPGAPRFETGGDDWNAADAGEAHTVPTRVGSDELRADDDAWSSETDDVTDAGEVLPPPVEADLGDHADDQPVDEGDSYDDVHDGDVHDGDVHDGDVHDGDVHDGDVHDGDDGDDYDGDDEYAAPARVGAPPGQRDIARAAAVGGGLAVLAIVLLVLGAKFMVPLVALVLAFAAVEYFGKLREVGWEAATFLGVVACFSFPLAVYWRGPAAAALVGFLVVVAVFGWYLVGAGGPEPRVLEGAGATLLGVFWIGGLGSAAAAILQVPDGRWLFATAILATVAYDVGGLLIGQAMGHRPLSAASPNKTWEGLLGGVGVSMAVTIVMVGILGLGPWTGLGASLALGLGAAIAAPLGDLCQSLLKRDLGVKDMGSILPGHGGVLDRFDGMLFVMPTVFWLAVAVGNVIA